jgi:hypothetical protein
MFWVYAVRQFEKDLVAPRDDNNSRKLSVYRSIGDSLFEARDRRRVTAADGG